MKTTPREKQRENKQERIKKSKYSGQERQSAEHAGNEYKRFKLFFCGLTYIQITDSFIINQKTTL